VESQLTENPTQCQDGQDQADIGSDIWIQQTQNNLYLLKEKNTEVQ
jgi:hypothetical protein